MMETRFKDLSIDEKEELEYEFEHNLLEAKHSSNLAMIDLKGIFDATKNGDFAYLQECQESYLQNCNQHLIAMNNINKLIKRV